MSPTSHKHQHQTDAELRQTGAQTKSAAAEPNNNSVRQVSCERKQAPATNVATGSSSSVTIPSYASIFKSSDGIDKLKEAPARDSPTKNSDCCHHNPGASAPYLTMSPHASWLYQTAQMHPYNNMFAHNLNGFGNHQTNDKQIKHHTNYAYSDDSISKRNQRFADVCLAAGDEPRLHKYARAHCVNLVLKSIILMLVLILLTGMLVGIAIASHHAPRVIEELMSKPHTFHVTVSGG